MTDVYEVSIQTWDSDHRYEVEHRFPTLPETATLVALKAEAYASFEGLFGGPPDGAAVLVMTLAAQERTTNEPVTANKS